MNGVSVIICCHNSSARLPLALEYLAKQKTNLLSWELVIVNNNSSDDTVEVANNVWRHLGNKTNLNLVNEDRPGLNYARETGVKASQYDVIIFCDDDNLLAENYVQYAYQLVETTKVQGFAVWGGKPAAFFDGNVVVPEWFEKANANYVVGKQASVTGDISARGYIWGAGMVMLKSVFTKVVNEKFPLLLTDRTGVVLNSGGDSEISLRSLIAGYKLYYDEQLLLKHYIPAYRLTVEYNNALIKGFATSEVVLNKYKTFIYYIVDKSKLRRLYYTAIYLIKYYLNQMKLRNLTAYDKIALKALCNNNKFFDADFKFIHKFFNETAKRR